MMAKKAKALLYEVPAPQVAAATDGHFVVKDGIRFAGQHLIIDLWGGTNLDNVELVQQTLTDAVEHQHAAEAGAFEDDDLLKGAPSPVEGADDLVRLAETGMERFREPGHGIKPRFISETWMLLGKKARRSTGSAL